MKRISICLLLLLVATVACYSKNSIPSMWLNNWSNMIVMWENNRRLLNGPATYPIGVSDVRVSANWEESAIQADAFVLKVGNTLYQDPKLFDGDSYLSENGTMITEYTTYDGHDLDFTLIGHVQLGPTQESFYIRSYYVVDDSQRPVSLMAYVTTETPKNTENVYGWHDTNNGFFEVDIKPTGLYLATYADQTYSKFQIGSPNTPSDPVNQFAGSGLQGQTVSNTPEAVIGMQFDGTGGLAISLYRAVGSNWADVVAKAKAAKAHDYLGWLSMGSVAVEQKLNSAILPSGTAEEVRYFKLCLLLLKNAQHPTIGTITASFHPCYGYKTWARDGAFAALILTAVGFTEEASKYLSWMGNAELRGDGMYHTTYATFTGKPESFVEPQLDPMGTFMLSVGYYTATTGDRTLARSVAGRLGAVQDYLIHNQPYKSFTSPDYSIWEESSDPVTGAGLPVGFYTFSQSMSAGGLFSAAYLWGMMGDSARRSAATARARELQAAIVTNLWQEDLGHFARQIWSDSKQVQTKLDGASSAPLFLGLIKTSDSMYSRQLDAVSRLITRDNHGVARYEGDVFFYSGVFNPAGAHVPEVSSDMPAWGVTTMFTAWAELRAGKDVSARLKWMRDRSAYGGIAVGEAVDGNSAHEDTFVFSSAPDIYEHAGVYAVTTLISQGKALPVCPFDWD
ncbi:Prokaryotic membrane lipoprotein lipid attachment site [Carpediemonas membranifera]|uniref:Prokaryotic membrane lipoprotein lipid attachment site n=1 Tax=Carpediemonas membranifera TaxID=201153 RepID=A0A8J6AZZ8_9EUKA|nr:Prokaryotic membrane lipoprotein lipid attachment site [Carpediemonas membranifera]|eukprot:KAG9395490.1 Prokaryotic membrane lipoprotein lipid attachment site [Carpediemonas membranifera]